MSNKPTLEGYPDWEIMHDANSLHKSIGVGAQGYINGTLHRCAFQAPEGFTLDEAIAHATPLLQLWVADLIADATVA